MQPTHHSAQRTKQGTNIQTRRVGLNNRQRGKGASLTKLVSHIIQNVRNVVNVGGNTTRHSS